MSNSSVDTKLRRLDEKEITVLYWKCQGLNRELIGDRMGYGEDMVAVFSTRMYNKLEFDPKQHPSKRKQILDEQYCPALMSYGSTISAIVQNLQSPPPHVNPDPQVGSNGWIIVIQDNTREDVAKEINRAIQKYPEAQLREIPLLRMGIDDPGLNPQPNRRSSMVPWAVTTLLLFILIGIGTVILFRTVKSIPPDESSKTSAPIPVAQVVTQNVTQVITQVITQNITQVEQAVTMVVPTSPPTEIPRATDTPQPTILFEDYFADGLDPRWQIQGNYFVVEDFLTTNENVFTLFIPGDWQNFRATINYADWGDTIFFVSTFGLRVQDQGNYVGLTGAGGGSGVVGWDVVKNGQTTEIPNSRFSYPIQNGEITLEAIDDSYQVVGYTKVIIPEFESGGFLIKIRKDMKLYSVKIVAIP